MHVGSRQNVQQYQLDMQDGPPTFDAISEEKDLGVQLIQPLKFSI